MPVTNVSSAHATIDRHVEILPGDFPSLELIDIETSAVDRTPLAADFRRHPFSEEVSHEGKSSEYD